MNQKGEIVGLTSFTAELGFIYRDGQFSTFSYPDSSCTNPQAINNEGAIAGTWGCGLGFPFGQIFTYRDGRFENLGYVFGESNQRAVLGGINRFGMIVGNAIPSGIEHPQFSPFVYFPGEGFQDLNQVIPSGSGWYLVHAVGINDRGQIVGTGLLNGDWHGFLLTPTSSAGADEDTEATPASE
jgi:hypothetical protein